MWLLYSIPFIYSVLRISSLFHLFYRSADILTSALYFLQDLRHGLFFIYVKDRYFELSLVNDIQIRKFSFRLHLSRYIMISRLSGSLSSSFNASLLFYYNFITNIVIIRKLFSPCELLTEQVSFKVPHPLLLFFFSKIP